MKNILLILLSLTLSFSYAQVQIGGDIDGEAVNDRSGEVSLSANGNRMVVGAFLNDGNGDRAGHARVFELIGGEWQQLGEDIDGEVSGDWIRI